MKMGTQGSPNVIKIGTRGPDLVGPHFHMTLVSRLDLGRSAYNIEKPGMGLG